MKYSLAAGSCLLLACLLTACGGAGSSESATPSSSSSATSSLASSAASVSSSASSASAASSAGASSASSYSVAALSFDLETENMAAASGDVDDPAIWVHATDRSKSLVVAAVKDGGLRVYDLQGQVVQSIAASILVHDTAGKSRFNNVDVVYGFKLANGTTVDLAVASDRGQDLIRVWKIDGDSAAPLTDITSATPLRLFPLVPATGSEADSSKDVSIKVSKQNTGYGLTHWSDSASGKHYVLVNQRKQARVQQFELVAEVGGTVNVAAVSGRDWRFPYTYKGQSLLEASDTDASRDWSPQFEGMVVDQRNGILYAGQEDVGIWRINLKTGEKLDSTAPFYETRGSGVASYVDGTSSVKHSFFNPESRISRDLEGLSIYYGPDGGGYLIASSQGGAHGTGATLADAPYDDSFVVLTLDGSKTPVFKGGFRISKGAAGQADGVQECDGADVIALQLPGYPYGVFISQDGYNDDLDNLSDVTHQTNLKYTSWEKIATALGLAKYDSFDPRKF
ncbi:phytase [Uliginosibacterium aquaticum]|uniref:Phytase n=1 Tax=Uliginosibacterium aquaticum TaxID=2731212 RepID=A0ABX2IRS2_9RHOO|nr:phytase [Uliginosibacterium aquaticum]NSL56981.1 phytase [Uliginosibacterium aquaticum]